MIGDREREMSEAQADRDAADQPARSTGTAQTQRRMVAAALLGRHVHETVDGRGVQVWVRNGKYLARGRHGGHAFGQSLGAGAKEATAALRRLLVQLEDGTFRAPSEARKRQLKSSRTPRNSIRQLCDAFLVEKRKLRGKQTADNYRNRLTPLIEFSERPDALREWPLAADINRDFVVRFRTFLHERKVTRNGRAAATEKPLSPGQIFNILDCARTMFSWARRPEVQQIPSTCGNPFTDDLVDHRPRKDPLRPVVFPLDVRIRLTALMDPWQLCQLGIALVLPLRPEDYTGLLISEVDFTNRLLYLGTRLDGWDFNKGQQSFRVPFPPELEPLFRRCADGRSHGPLLRQRTIVDRRRHAKLLVDSIEQIRDSFTRAMAGAKPGEIQGKQDGKRLFRRLLRAMGGVSPNSLGKEFDSLVAHAEVPAGARFYDLRGSASTDLKDAKVDPLIQKYVTGHSLEADIMSRYVSLRLHDDMQAYFQHIQPLLNAIARRAKELGLTALAEHDV